MAKFVSGKPSITACIIVHNEENVIERCLKSIADLVDDILVVHDGPCTDQSVTICRKYTKRVHVRPHIGEAEPHRAWMYSQVKTDWIIQLDADEYLSKELQANLNTLCANREIAAYTFIWPYWDGKKYQTRLWPRKKSLFQTTKIQFLAFPHEEVRTPRTVDTLYRLEHKPSYDNYTWVVFQKKWMNWAKIHANYFALDPKTLDRFPKKQRDLLPHYYKESRQPLVWILPLTLYHFLGSFLLGGYKEGYAGFKISAMTATYYFCVMCEHVKRRI